MEPNKFWFPTPVSHPSTTAAEFDALLPTNTSLVDFPGPEKKSFVVEKIYGNILLTHLMARF